MQQNIHGGDIYSRQIRLDFSVNGNPLGMPDAAVQAIHEVVQHVGEYPDITAAALTEAPEYCDSRAILLRIRVCGGSSRQPYKICISAGRDRIPSGAGAVTGADSGYRHAVCSESQQSHGAADGQRISAGTVGALQAAGNHRSSG